MITGLSVLTVLVHDQDEALEFFTEMLGLELENDVTIAEGFRWLTVSPPNADGPQITLVEADTEERKARVGNQVVDHVLCVFETEDCQEAYETLRDRGVQFLGEPSERPWGTEVVFEDLYGNRYDLHEPAAGRP